MDTKRLRNNHPKKIKPGRDSEKKKHEILVLPPDLLKKLGISFGNGSHLQQIPSDTHGIEINNDNIGNSLASNDYSKEANSSILETASLMKTSVFLSPTFVSTAVNVIPGEVEILSKNNVEVLVDIKDSKEEQSSYLEPVDSIEISKSVPDTNSIQQPCHKEDQTYFCDNITVNGEYVSKKKDDQDWTPMAPNVNEELEVDVNRNLHENLKKVEHSYGHILHNAHSSKNNIDFNFTVNSTEINTTSILDINAGKDKIVQKFSRENIISEETIPLSKLKELKSLQSSNLTPVPINSIIGTSKPTPIVPVNNTKSIDSNVNASTSADNTNVSNLVIKDINNDINTNFATSTIFPQNVEAKICRISDIAPNEIENMEKSDINVGHCSRDKCNNEADINVIQCNGLKEQDSDAINVDSSKEDKCVKTNIYLCDQSSTEVQPNSNNAENRIPSPNEQECSADTREKSICLMKETISAKNHITKCNLKQNVCSKSTSKQVIHSKPIVDNHCIVAKSTEDNRNVSSMLKNNEDKILPSLELANILNASKELSGSITKVDKVKEIAAYLKKYSHIYMDKKKIKKEHCNEIIKKEIINSNASTIKSKLCIQGVEKPGGNKNDKGYSNTCKVVKTYSRRNPKRSKLTTNMLHTYESSYDDDYKLNTMNIQMPYEVQQFCLCFDFGRLGYYDNDDMYEHLHFWKHDTVDCESDIIFDIYNDVAIVNNYEREFEQEEKTEEKVEAYTHHLCWNIFQNEFIKKEDNPNQEQMAQYPHVNNTSKDDFKETPQVTELENVPQKGNIVPEICDQAQIIDSNSEIVLETTDQDMVNIEKPSNVYQNDKIDSAVITSAVRENINANLSTLEPTLTVFPENSGVKERSSSNVKENTYSKKSEYNESRSNTKEDAKEVNLDSPKQIEKAARKRTFPGKQTLPLLNKSGEHTSFKKSIKCGVCYILLSEMEWENHVTEQHHLIAWRAGSSIDIDDPDLITKLKKRLKTVGMLTCSICQMETRKLKKFIAHVKECVQQKLLNTNKKSDKPTRKSRTDESVTCGVCQSTLPSLGWIEHIGRNHSYLAWTKEQPALNLQDEAVVKQHLQNIIRLNGSLTCYKCGFNRSRFKLYLEHIKTCDGSGISNDASPSPTSNDLNCTSTFEDHDVEQPDEVRIVKCGVCKEDVNNTNWIEHIAREHNYMAWQEGDTPLNTDDEDAVWEYLQQFIRQNGGLTCYKCGLNRKRVKLYLTHIETCDGTTNQGDNSLCKTDQWFEVPIESDERKVVKCAVCSQEVAILEWMQHIGKEHNYLAWQEGCTPLNLDDESELRLYLLNVSKQFGGLVCSKCEKIMKYPKSFLQHLKECNGARVSVDSSKLNDSVSPSQKFYRKLKKIKGESVTCGVCATQIDTDVWIDHLQKVHQYLAWIEGQTPLDLENPEMVQQHLYDMSKIMGGLVCMKCGVRRKYVKTYQQHIETCQGNVCSTELSMALMKEDILECAICSEKVVPKDWRSHAMTKHYNIAWVVGDVPIEINNPYAVESYLKEYLHRNNKLVCKVCGISRMSCVGFYAHIISCGKTEEETEMYKSVCDICHNKYLRIYKSQHMTMHREQEYALERKLLVAKEKELKKEGPVEVVGGRRKAAERAQSVIEKYKNGFHDGSHYHCTKCGFSSEIETELSDHVCVEAKWGDASDSDVSVKLENCSDEDSDETDIDSNISDEEREAREQSSHKKRCYDSIVRMPYQVRSISAYMKKSTEEFIDIYLTEEDLFKQWRSCECKEVLENDVEKYMPPIEESCKLRFDENENWMSLNRFESIKIKDTIVMFLGGSIQCMSWVPALGAVAQYVSAATHRRADVPRLAWDATPAAHGLIQIWDCAYLLSSTPKLVLGIAHDYGTVWAIDWCPSGARDAFDFVPEGNQMHRLGLLAAACSNGSAYIFVVPYPSSITEKDRLFYKLKPVVELRLVSNDNRKVYQASAIKWSPQKGHSHVVVGYADGTTAYYDLNGDSPILRKTENNMTIFYPYHDERVQNSCIEDVDIYPSGEEGGAGGVGGAGGACVRGGGVVAAGSAAGAGAAALQSHLSAARVLFPPHWPAALLAGDDCIVNQSINELEWWGGGRRLGGARVAAGCAWCGRVAAAALPVLRLMRLHPCFAEVHKQVIGTIRMAPLGSKRKRQTDELAMIVEPITYSEAVNKYGIEFKKITAKDKTSQQKLSAMPRDAYPERFPLSDVAALQFCPTFTHHHKLALAMHAGFIFIINV